MLDVKLTSNYLYLTVVAKRITGNDTERASDLISDTYLKLHTKGTKIPEDDEGFIKFFSKCMANTNLNKIRSQKRANECDLSIDITQPVEVPKWVFLREIEIFKNELTDLEQILFELVFEMGLSCREIAELLTHKFGYKISHNHFSDTLVRPLREKIKQKKWNGLTTWDY